MIISILRDYFTAYDIKYSQFVKYKIDLLLRLKRIIVINIPRIFLIDFSFLKHLPND